MDGSPYKECNGSATLTVLLLLGFVVSWTTYYVVCFAVLKQISVSTTCLFNNDLIKTAVAEAIARKLVNNGIYEKNVDVSCVLPSDYTGNGFDAIRVQTHCTGSTAQCVINFLTARTQATRTFQIKKRAHGTVIVPLRS